MPVTEVDRNVEKLTLTITSEFDAGLDRIWQMWEDPRLLEKWWGPPTWPATFAVHEFTPGGKADYFMTGPDGERSPRCWWRFAEIDAPHHLVLDNGFADEDGEPDDQQPSMTVRVTIEAVGDSGSATRMIIENQFRSTEDMEQLLEMGMSEGMAAAIGQIDGLL